MLKKYLIPLNVIKISSNKFYKTSGIVLEIAGGFALFSVTSTIVQVVIYIHIYSNNK